MALEVGIGVVALLLLHLCTFGTGSATSRGRFCDLRHEVMGGG